MIKRVDNALQWLKIEGWKDEKELSSFLLTKYKLESITPPLLVKKGGQLFFVAVFNKSSYFYSKKHGLVTGMDKDRYEDLCKLSAETQTPVAFLFYSLEEDKYIFRQLNQLPKPIYWHKDARKKRATVVWKVEKFTDNTSYQDELFKKQPLTEKELKAFKKYENVQRKTKRKFA